MDCKHEWTVRFPNVSGVDGPFEIRPLTMDFQDNRGEFAYAQCKFPTDVGATMKPETRYEGGKLRDKNVVQLLHEGQLVHALYFKPDFASYGDQYTHLEFHDLLKSMDSGTVDKEWGKVSLREAYNYVFERQQSDLVKEVRFTIPSETATRLYGQDFPYANSSPFYSNKELVRTIEEDGTARVVDSSYAVDFDKVSPAKAILTLNKKFSVNSWVDNQQTLWVGFPEAAARLHVAAPDDDRVWRYSGEGVNIRHPREPVKQVTIEGAWVDEPGRGNVDDAIREAQSWFGRNDQGAADVRAAGVAYRTDIDYGESLVYSDSRAKRDALPGVAETTMRELMKQGHSGTVEIETELSGNFSNLELVAPGDLIRLIPNDHHFDNPTSTSGEIGDEPEDLDNCSSFVNNEIYLITGVQHHVDDNGYWSVTLDVGMYPDVLDENMESSFVYFDPQSESWITEEKFNDLEGQPFESLAP